MSTARVLHRVAWPSWDRYLAHRVFVMNGESRDLALVDETVDGLLHALGAVPERVAVEQNGAIVKRAARATTRVMPGDIIEIVTLVGGG